MPDQPNQAIADLAHQLGTALVAFAEGFRPDEIASSDSSASGLDEFGLGRRQREIAELPGLNTNHGMRAAEVATAIDYDPANTHTALKALGARGVLEEFRPKDDGPEGPDGPPRWRLAPSFRGMSDPYLRMAGLVRPGEWTTYGDISIACPREYKRGESSRPCRRDASAFPESAQGALVWRADTAYLEERGQSRP